jgi:predicted dienelactone hydrolase
MGKHARRRQPSRMAARAATTAGAIAVVVGAGAIPANAAAKAPATRPDKGPDADLAHMQNDLPSVEQGGTAQKPNTLSAATATHVTLPSPVGKYPVGTTSLHLRDTSRPDPYISGSTSRDLMVQVWYPAASTTGYASAPWLQSAAASKFLSRQGLTSSQVSLPTTAGHTTAPVATAAGKLPVIFYDTGLRSDRSLGTTLVQDMASRGYVVVMVDHTHDANEVQFPNGSLQLGNLPSVIHASDILSVRSKDTSFTLDELTAITKGQNPTVEHSTLPTGLASTMDMSRVGVFGWSLGGAEAGTAMYNDKRIKVGADLDGTFYGPVATNGVGDRPFMLMSAESHNLSTDSSWRSFWPKVTGTKYDVRVAGTKHLSFSDNEELLPQEASALHLSSSQLQSELGTITPSRAITVERAYLAAFFGQQLKHETWSILNGPSSSYPEVSFVK